MILLWFDNEEKKNNKQIDLFSIKMKDWNNCSVLKDVFTTELPESSWRCHKGCIQINFKRHKKSWDH